jgi:hypothetical protein
MRQFTRRCGNNSRAELDNAAFGVLEDLEARIMLSTVVTTPVSSSTTSTNQPSSVVQALSETVGNTWINTPIASQNGSFQFSFNATPTQNDENVVMGLSDGSADAYTELAAIVRFNPNGQIDVRDGSAYQADNTVNYVAGTSYSFTMDVDAATQTYSVYVTPAGGSQVELASNYTFRSEQAGTSVLDNFSGYALVGSANITGGTNAMQTDGDWDNTTLASQDAPFQISFDATPSQDDENVVLGLSDGAASVYADLAAIVRFNPNGQIDVRNGSNYQADNTVDYTAGTTYAITMDVDPTTQTYSVYVTPAGGSQVELASDYSFRTEQAGTSTLNNLSAYALVGSAAVSNVDITSTAPTTPSSPTAPSSPTSPSSPPTVLNAPSNLSATSSSSSQINLSWTDNSGGSEQGFDVLESTNGGSYSQVATVGSGVTNYSATGLSASTTYSFEVEAFTSSQTSAASSSASATTAAAVSTPASSGTAGPTVMPGPSNTGPQSGVTLTPSGTVTVTQDGAVIQNLAITGQLFIDANNVTIKNCTVNDGDQSNYYAVQIEAGITNTTIENSSFTNTGDGAYAIVTEWQTANTTISNCQFYNTAGSAIDLNGESATVENNWFYEIGNFASGVVNNGQTGDFHTDDIFMSNGTLNLLNNNIDSPNATTINGVNYGDASILFICPFSSADVIGTVNIENNYIDGGGYMFYMMGQGQVTVANNVIGADYGYNIIYPSYVGDPIVWTNNVFQPTGQTLSAPVVSNNVLTAEPS